MKRNWITYVSIVAAILAGMVCSTAFADGKKGMKFSGGNLRVGNGGGGGGGGTMQFQQLNRTNVILSQNLGGTLGGNTGGLQSQSFKKIIKNPQINGGIGQIVNGQGQNGQGLNGIRTAPGKFTGNLNNGGGNGGLGITLGNQINNKPKITINPNGQAIGGAILGNGKKATIGIHPNIGQAIGNSAIGNSAIGNAVLNKAKISGSIGGSIATSLASKYCAPKFCAPACNPKPCDPCHNHCNKWCGPTWWWSPCWDPCYKSCYYPTTVYAVPQTIVVPVQTVVAGAPVAQPVAEPLMQIPVGATITLQGNDLGDQLGMLAVQIDKISLPAQVNEWTPAGVNVTLPMMGLAGPTRAQLWMVRADGAVAANVAVELLPAQQQQAAGAAVGQVDPGQAAPQDAAAAALSAIQ